VLNLKIAKYLSNLLKIYKKFPTNAFDDTLIIYTNEFICKLTSENKGNGRYLLGMILEYIQNTYFKGKIVFISIFAVSNQRIDSHGNIIYPNNPKLVQFYNKLCFH
jgi:hypothetical protein